MIRGPAERRGRGGVRELVRLGAFLAALPRAMTPSMARLTVSGCERSVSGARMIEGIRPYALYHAGHTRANARGIIGVVRAY